MESEASCSQNLPPTRGSSNKYARLTALPRFVPDEYTKAAKACQLFANKNIPIEQTLDPTSFSFVDKEAYYLAQKTIIRLEQINYILNKLEIFKNNKMISPWLARVIVTEILFCRHQYARSKAKEIESLKYFEETMRDMFVETITVVPHSSDVMLPVYVRINVISMSIDDSVRAFVKEGWHLLPRCETYNDYLFDLKHISGKNFMRDFHISELFVFPPRTVFYDHPGYLRGKFLLQDKGSCLSSFLLNPKPGSIALDICAAPGLKTNHLANIMNNEGLIIANDHHPFRYKTLCNLLDLTDTKCVQTFEFDQFNIHNKIADTEEIQYILVDPTCTYSGLFYKSRKNSSKIRLQKIRYKSSMLLKYCLQTFPNLKRLVFTTCSVYPEEGERVVCDALEEVGDSYTLLNAKEMLWNEWRSKGVNTEYLYNSYECSEKCLRTVPERDHTPGYFIAVFERNFDIPVPSFVNIDKNEVNIDYYADQTEEVERSKPPERVVQTYEPKKKEKFQQMPSIQKKDSTIFTKVKKMFQYQNKVEKATFVKNKTNPPPQNKYKYVSNEYKKKQKQQALLQQGTSQAFSQQKFQPPFLQKGLLQNPKPFPIKKPAPSSQSALVSYPILNKLKVQQFSQSTESQSSQSKLHPQYSKKQRESEDSQPKSLLQYSQPKLQSQFSRSLHHEKLGLVSYPIFNKLMSSSKYYDEEIDEDDA